MHVCMLSTAKDNVTWNYQRVIMQATSTPHNNWSKQTTDQAQRPCNHMTSQCGLSDRQSSLSLDCTAYSSTPWFCLA